MIKLCPGTLKTANASDDEVPTHIACQHNAAFPELIKLLAFTCPSTLTMQNDTGASPLHVAIRSGTQSEAAIEVINARPLALACFEAEESGLEQTPVASATQAGQGDLAGRILGMPQSCFGALMECSLDPSCLMGADLRSQNCQCNQGRVCTESDG